MQRVVIVGSGGSGKTHVARRLAALLRVPVVHLDAEYYDPDWRPAADTVVLCDLPAPTCLWGIAQRQWRHGAGQHPALGVYARLSRPFLSYVARYRRRMRPRVRHVLAEHAQHADVVVLKSRRTTRRWLDRVAAGSQRVNATGDSASSTAGR